MTIRYIIGKMTANPVGWNTKLVPIASIAVITIIKHPLAKTRRMRRRMAALFATLVPPPLSFVLSFER